MSKIWVSGKIVTLEPCSEGQKENRGKCAQADATGGMVRDDRMEGKEEPTHEALCAKLRTMAVF